MNNKSDARQLANQIADMVNTMCKDIITKDFVEEMSCQHRTLQQNFTRLCVNWLKELNKNYENGYYDLRNEASCKLANEIIKNCDEYLFLPCV